MIEKIIVYLNDAEKTSIEFDSLADFLASDVYVAATAPKVETPVEVPAEQTN